MPLIPRCVSSVEASKGKRTRFFTAVRQPHYDFIHAARFIVQSVQLR